MQRDRHQDSRCRRRRSFSAQAGPADSSLVVDPDCSHIVVVRSPVAAGSLARMLVEAAVGIVAGPGSIGWQTSWRFLVEPECLWHAQFVC